MTTSWPLVTLDDVAVIVGRGITPKYAEDGDYLVVNQKCVRDGRVSFDQARRHDSSQRAVRADKVIRTRDILVNSTGVGTLGRTAPVRSVPGPMTADSHLTIVRPATTVDPSWLAYAISSLEPSIEAMGEGSTGQTELSRHRLSLLELSLPPRSEQQAIAATLGALDDKIESNRRQQALLRVLGQSKYHSATEQAPRVFSLSDLTLSIARGVAPRYADDDLAAPLVVNQRCIRDGWVSLAPARRMHNRIVTPAKRANGGDILVNSTGTGTLGRIARWHDGDVFVDGHVSVVKPDPQVVPPTVLAYALLQRQADIEELATGSTGQTELSPTRLGTLPVTLPSAQAVAELESDLLALENRAAQLASEIVRLERTRDNLLPELLSGRVRVPAEEKAA